jgi:hypothetical protein
MKPLIDLKDQKTNWKYILIMAFLALIASGGILIYLSYFLREIEILFRFPQIKELKTIKRIEIIGLEKWRIKDPISNVEIIARENVSNKEKTDIFIRDLKTDTYKEVFFVTLSAAIPEINHEAEFRNGHLYISVIEDGQIKLKRFSKDGEKTVYEQSSEKGGSIDFKVSPDEAFVAINGNEAVFFDKIFAIINLNTGEIKEFDYKHLAPKEMLSIQLNPPYQIPRPITIEIGNELGKWSPDSQEFSGYTFLWFGEFDYVEATSNFKINIKNWNIEIGPLEKAGPGERKCCGEY